MKKLKGHSDKSKFLYSDEASKKQTPASSDLSRRKFMENSLMGGTGLILGVPGLLFEPVVSRKISNNDKIVLGVMGLGSRNCFLIEEFIKQGAEIAYICDVDQRRYADGLNACKGQSRKPKSTQDFRRMLDDKEITAMVIAPGTHWAPLATIMSCQAGKDVYVEKPMSHDVYEGRKMVEAARKYNRVVQVGCQNRSGQYHQKAIEHLKAGVIGKVHYIRVLNILNGRQGSPGPYPGMPVPKAVDYDMWCGPAPKLPYNTKKTVAGVWRYFWEYSGSDSESIHQLDIARWVTSALTGLDYPLSVYAKGAVRYPERVADIPDSLNAIYDYGDITLSLDVNWWSSLVKIPEEIRWSETVFPKWQFIGTRIEIYGTNGMMYLGRHGGGWQTFDAKGEPGPMLKGVMPIKEHVANFLGCVRTRQVPNGEIEEAHLSQAISHMAYISYRVGNQLLKIDGTNERFVDNGEANKLLARSDGGRSPWKIPVQV